VSEKPRITRCTITRTFGQSVLIGDSRVTIEKKKGGSGFLVVIEAPSDLLITREELLLKDPPPSKP